MIGVVRAVKLAGLGLGGVVALVGVLYVGGVVGLPDAGLEGNEWGEVDDQRIEVVSTIWVENPNPVGASVERVEYDLAMNEVHLATGEAEDVAVPPGRETIELRTDLNYTRLPDWWQAHVENDEVGDVAVTATVHAEIAGRTIARPVSHEDEIETDVEGMLADALSELEGEYTATDAGTGGVAGVATEPTVEVRDTDAEWGEVTDERTELLATFEVHNPNAYPVPTPGFSGEFAMNDVEVLQWDANEVDVVRGPTDGVIPPQATREVVLRVHLDNERFAEWFATHVDADEQTEATLTTQLAMSVAGYELRIPSDGEAMRCDYDLNTSIFVDQEAGLERQDCTFTAWETTRSDLEDADATLSTDDPEWEDGDGSEGGEDGADDDTDDTDNGGDDDDGDEDDGTNDDGDDSLVEVAGLLALLRS